MTTLTLSAAYSALIAYNPESSLSKNLSISAIREKFEQLSDPSEQIEFAMNMATHNDPVLSNIGKTILTALMNKGDSNTRPLLESAASQLTAKWVTDNNQTWSFDDHFDNNTKVQLWQLSRQYDVVNNPGHFAEKQHKINTEMCQSISNQYHGITEQDAHNVLNAGNMVEYAVLTQSVESINHRNEQYIALSTVVYNDPDSLKTGKTTFGNLNVATNAIETLNIGETLMVPIHDKNHFSSIQILKTKNGFDVAAFDSKKTDKALHQSLIASLELQGKVDISWCMENFQAQNDCAIHVYEFFRFCAENKNDNFSTNFANYTSIVDLENISDQGLDQSKYASSVRRQNFVMDLFKSSPLAHNQ